MQGTQVRRNYIIRCCGVKTCSPADMKPRANNTSEGIDKNKNQVSNKLQLIN